jgi:hypothetical protein
VVAVAPPFAVECARPAAAAVGVPFAVTYTVANRTPHFQTLAVHASLRHSLLLLAPAALASGLPAAAPAPAQPAAAPSFSFLAADGLWTPYAAPVAAALAAGFASSPRGGRVFLADPLSAASALAFATGGYLRPAAEEEELSVGVGVGLAASASAASFEVRWGAEARAAKLPLPRGHADAAPSLVQVSGSGYARAVRRDDDPQGAVQGLPAPGTAAAAASGEAAAGPAAAAAAAACVACGGGEGDSFLWAGLRSGTVVLDPFGAVELTYSLVALKAGIATPLLALDVASAALAGVNPDAGRGAAAFVLRESCRGPPPAIFVAPLSSTGTAGQP